MDWRKKPAADELKSPVEMTDDEIAAELGLDTPAAPPPPDIPTRREMGSMVRQAIGENKRVDDLVVDVKLPPDTLSPDEIAEIEASAGRITDYARLSQLVDDDFPFDESQLEAINGLAEELYGCMTGAAGTGKTTSTKKLVDKLLSSVSMSAVNLKTYWKAGYEPDEADDDYEQTADWVPSIAMCSYTGRATQMTKRNFPRDWHSNIMTIHRMLGFMPEYYEDWDDEHYDENTGTMGGFRKKMRFVPTYTADCLLPWDVIIIDEAGMLGVDLWHQLLAATKPGCRIYMIGDINQLPPVHGKSVFGFAMAKWPSWELTHVHRQKGATNPIVDNAWRILHGRMPQSEGRFQMMELKGDSAYSSRQLRALIPALKEKGIFDPIRDTIITPINGEPGSRGRELGQLPLNDQFALIFNPQSQEPRYIIDGGRERKQFAVGDKVMATRNDWDAGITNGMTGIIISIADHEGYSGDRRRFGRVEDVNRYMQEDADLEEEVPIDFESLNDTMVAQEEGMRAKREKRDRGPASHIVTVRFGDAEHGIEIPFATLSEVATLMTAYVVTCHKMQGGEAPVVVIICHESHKSMLYREWLYTAVTRASEKCILLYTQQALKSALTKQNIKGSTLQEKVAAFNALQDKNSLLGAAVMVDIPDSPNQGNRLMDRRAVAPVAQSHMLSDAERTGGLASLLKKSREKLTQPEPKVIHRTTIHTTEIHIHTQESSKNGPVDGGTISPDRVPTPAPDPVPAVAKAPTVAALPAPAPLRSQWGAVRTLHRIRDITEQKLLTHQPAPVETPKAKPNWMRKK